MKTKYVIEGVWSGYKSSQQKVVHRTVEFCKPTVSTIQYSDGTTLDISVRNMKKYERVVVLDSYSKLIDQANRFGKAYVTVNEIVEEENNRNRPPFPINTLGDVG